MTKNLLFVNSDLLFWVIEFSPITLIVKNDRRIRCHQPEFQHKERRKESPLHPASRYLMCEGLEPYQPSPRTRRTEYQLDRVQALARCSK